MIWDINIRIFHFLLIILVIISISSQKLNLNYIHQYSGITILCLLIFRIYWGIFGSFYSRFVNFNLSYNNVKLFVKKSKIDYIGHNPLGSLSILTFYVILFFTGFTGLLSSDDILFDGPLTKYFPEIVKTMTTFHNLLHYILYILICTHIFFAIYYQFFKKQKIINQMITGKSNRDDLVLCNISNLRLFLGFFLILLCLIIPIFFV